MFGAAGTCHKVVSIRTNEQLLSCLSLPPSVFITRPDSIHQEITPSTSAFEHVFLPLRSLPESGSWDASDIVESGLNMEGFWVFTEKQIRGTRGRFCRGFNVSDGISLIFQSRQLRVALPGLTPERASPPSGEELAECC